MTVNFIHGVFLPIRIQFDNTPEQHSDEAYKEMQSRLNVVEAKENEQRKSLELEQEQHRQVLESFFTQHKPGRDSQRKRPRLHKARPTERRSVQVNSVWNAKVEHIYSTMNGHNSESEDHLFTFPFATTTNSLKKCGSKSFDLSANKGISDIVDNDFASVVVHDPIVVTTAAVRSLTPGMKTDEDTIDLCLQWYVLLVKFFHS
jgi:hypothetical protein